MTIQLTYSKKTENLNALLNQSLMEREDIIEALFVALLAKKNVYLIGPGGEGKSLVALLFSQVMKAKYFEYQFHAFSKLDDWEGIVNLDDFNKGKLTRKSDNFAPHAQIILADELPRGQALLSCIYKLLNEGIYYVDGEIRKAALEILIAGSNSMLPSEHDALFDRFPFFMECNKVSNEALESIYLNDQPEIKISESDKMDMDMVRTARDEMKNVVIPPDLAKTMQIINAELEMENIHISTRLNRWCRTIIQANAYIHNRQEAMDEDVWILRNVLARTNKHRPKVIEILRKFVNQELNNILSLFDQITSFHTEWVDAKCPLRMSTVSGERLARDIIKEMVDEYKKITPKSINRSEYDRLLKKGNALLVSVSSSNVASMQSGRK